MTQHELLFILLAYLLGAVPFGFLLYYLFERKDIRNEGSGNIGATNLYRTQGTFAGIATLILDMLKGIAAVVYGLKHFDSPAIVVMGGAAVILGHLFPVYLKFKGGKGIAALIGVFIAFHWPTALTFGLVFLLAIYFYRYVSAASIAGVTAVFLSIMFTQIAEVAGVVLVAAILIILKHRTNIERLTAGTETKFYWKNNG